MKQIKIKIHKGKITYDLDGFQGTECVSAMEDVIAGVTQKLEMEGSITEMKESAYISDDPMQRNKESL